MGVKCRNWLVVHFAWIVILYVDFLLSIILYKMHTLWTFLVYHITLQLGRKWVKTDKQKLYIIQAMQTPFIALVAIPYSFIRDFATFYLIIFVHSKPITVKCECTTTNPRAQYYISILWQKINTNQKLHLFQSCLVSDHIEFPKVQIPALYLKSMLFGSWSV